MHIQTTQRRLWFFAAMITSLFTVQAHAESKVDIRQKKPVGRPDLAIAIRQSASRDAASGLARHLTPAKVLRSGPIKDVRTKTTIRQKDSVDHVRGQIDNLQKNDPLGQNSASTILSQEDIERLRMIETILDIRELHELDSLIGQDLANTHGQVMDMLEAALQDLMDMIAASMGSMGGMSSVGLAEERAEYAEGTIFQAFAVWLEGLCSDEGEGRFDDPDKDGLPNAADDDDDGDGVDDEDDAYPYDPDRSIFPENEVWLLSEGIPRELFDEFVYQWSVSGMNSEPLLASDIHVLLRLAIENWMTQY